ncbi:MAG: (d)CMP kinase [Bacteroidetes bacterium]|nr:(d)CMP kinase [Bacteroidota bacterium]
MSSRLIIAIDGYSSCGKSTVAKGLARKLGIHYIDSGAMYRAVTLYFLENNIPIPGPEELQDSVYDFSDALSKINITFQFNPISDFSEVYLNGRNVENEIRTMEINEQVSHVSAIKSVREHLVKLQRSAGKEGGLVMDGRDIGTTVFPNADLKIFMKADPMVRSERRFKELKAKGVDVLLEDVIQNVVGRDYEDSHREVSPLRKAEDAIILDNTYLTHEEQVEFVMEAVRKLALSNSTTS